MDVVADGHDQLLDIAKHATPQTSLREVTEESFDQSKVALFWSAGPNRLTVQELQP